jgi:hypothetical protein
MTGLSMQFCFKAMKYSGFDIKNTHLQDLKRIEKLLCLVMIAFVWCYKVVDYLDVNKLQCWKVAFRQLKSLVFFIRTIIVLHFKVKTIFLKNKMPYTR